MVKAVAGIASARLVVIREGDTDAMTLLVEPRAGQSADPQAIASALTAHTRLKGRVEIAAGLPNDGKVIDDRRDYSK